MLPYFFRHYDPWVDRYVFYDDGSTDQTLAILARQPKVEIRQLVRSAEKDSYVLAAQAVHNNCWRESRGLADWVMIAPVDEFLYAPNFLAFLAECTKHEVTAIPALGYQMISDTLPTSNQSLLKLVARGCPWAMMNKLSLFRPDKIAETNQQPGRHMASPVGEVQYPANDILLNLHYKYLSFEQTFNRHIELNQKLGTLDKENGWGNKYAWTKEQLRNDWVRFEHNSVENIFAPSYNPHLQHSPLIERWWRQSTTAA